MALRHRLTSAGEVLSFPVFGSLWVTWRWSKGRAGIVLGDPPERKMDGKKRADTQARGGRGPALGLIAELGDKLQPLASEGLVPTPTRLD